MRQVLEQKPRIVGFFSGLGGLELGFQQAGYEVLASNEVHPTICKTLRANFKHDILSQSVHNISVEDLRKDYRTIDGIIGGFPCPVYSTASDIHGARVGVRRPNDYTRYAALGGPLFLEFFRIIANLQPKFFVIENVAGMQGAKIVLETFRNTPCGGGDLPYYYVLYQGILNAKHFGLPQDRDRYFFIGARVNGNLALSCALPPRKFVVGDVLEENPALPWEPEIVQLPGTGERVKVIAPDYAKRRLLGITCRDRPIITREGPDSIAPTVVAHYAKDKGTRLVRIGDVIRPYTVKESARLQGISDDVVIEGSEFMQYTQIGNAVPVPVAYSIARAVKQLFN